MVDDPFAEIDDIRLALGDLCIAWAHLEDGYFTLVIYLLGASGEGVEETLRNQMDIRQMAAFQKAIASTRKLNPATPHIVALADIIDEKLLPPRNRYVHDPIYTWITHFSRSEYRTKFGPTADNPDVKFWKESPIRKGEIELLVECIRLAEEYSGAITAVIDDDEIDGQARMDDSANALKKAISEYVTLTKS